MRYRHTGLSAAAAAQTRTSRWSQVEPQPGRMTVSRGAAGWSETRLVVSTTWQGDLTRGMLLGHVEQLRVTNRLIPTQQVDSLSFEHLAGNTKSIRVGQPVGHANQIRRQFEICSGVSLPLEVENRPQPVDCILQGGHLVADRLEAGRSCGIIRRLGPRRVARVTGTRLWHLVPTA